MSYSVVFDVGGVLVPEGNRMERLQHFARQTLGEFEPSEFTAAYWEFRNDYDLGSSDEEFWGRVFTRAGVREYDDSDVAAVAARDAELNSTISSRVSDCLCVGVWFTSSLRIGRGKPRLVG